MTHAGVAFAGGVFEIFCLSTLFSGRLISFIDPEHSNQEFTTADSPHLDGVAGRALGIIETATMPGRIQASEMFPFSQSPVTASLLEAASRWICDATDNTAILSQRESRRVISGMVAPPPGSTSTFLNPGYCKVKREKKSQAKAQELITLALDPTTLETLYVCRRYTSLC